MGFEAIDKRHTPTAKLVVNWQPITSAIDLSNWLLLTYTPSIDGKLPVQQIENYHPRIGWQRLTPGGWVHTVDTSATHYVHLLNLQLPPPGDTP